MNDQLETLEHAKRTLIDLAIQFGPKVVVAVAIIVQASLYRWAAGIIDGGIKKFNLDPGSSVADA
jgi:small conductance mechanosensitive channel